MTDVQTTIAPATISEIQRLRVTVESFAPWLPTFHRWVAAVGRADAGMRMDWETNTVDLSTLATLTGENDQSINNLSYSLPEFARWLVGEGITEPDPVVPQGGQPVFDADISLVNLMRDTRANLFPVRDLFREWAAANEQPRQWREWVSDPSLVGPWQDAEARSMWDRDYTAFLTWLRQPENRSRIPMDGVPQGGQVAVAPIGPDTPGWTEWWDRLYEVAHEDDGYTEEYNTLARTLGGPVRDDDNEEVDVDVTITIPSFTIRLSRTVRRGEANTDYIGEHIDQGDIDDAIREYIAQEDVEYEFDEVEIDE